MWIGGLDALRKPLLHFHTQANLSLPWAEIDMDFMNLNQAAHGDREFGYIETRMRVRRKTVVGHATEARSRDGTVKALFRTADGHVAVAVFGDDGVLAGAGEHDPSIRFAGSSDRGAPRAGRQRRLEIPGSHLLGRVRQPPHTDRDQGGDQETDQHPDRDRDQERSQPVAAARPMKLATSM